VQCHLAGHSNCGTHIIDTHDDHVINPVWQLYKRMHELTAGVSTLLEWDANIPPFDVLHNEVLKARGYMDAEPDVFGDGVAESERDATDSADSATGDIATVPAGAGDSAAVDLNPTYFHPLHHMPAEVE